ncbi:MAG: hypothetical protein HW421_2290 [Ignavibacteria bacterium]|nr:hypothetical protein [Ignavibacteria bacterium]
MTPEQKEAIIQHRIQRAKETIEDARVALETNRIKNALNRIYYSAFHIVSSFAIKNEFSTSKHKQLIGWFNKYYVHTGIVSGDLYKIYSLSFNNRQESDYEDFVNFEKEEVEKHYQDMLIFVSGIEKIILK